MTAAKKLDMEYTGLSGVPAFTKAALKLLFGPDMSPERAVSAQTSSGTGSLRVAAEFLARWYPGAKKIYLPAPTWADFGFDKAGMLEDLKSAPEGSIFLLHACAHNPTGVDPTREDWKELLLS